MYIHWFLFSSGFSIKPTLSLESSPVFGKIKKNVFSDWLTDYAFNKLFSDWIRPYRGYIRKKFKIFFQFELYS
jgi:hypothetical protein